MKKFNENIEKALEISREMQELADKGDEERVDDGCGVLYGVVRDSAYRIRAMAEEEKRKHQNKGVWE